LRLDNIIGAQFVADPGGFYENLGYAVYVSVTLLPRGSFLVLLNQVGSLKIIDKYTHNVNGDNHVHE